VHGSVFMEKRNEDTIKLFQAILALPKDWNVEAFVAKADNLKVDLEAGFQRKAVGSDSPRDIPEGTTPYAVLTDHVLPQAPDDETRRKLEVLADRIEPTMHEHEFRQKLGREDPEKSQVHLHPAAMKEKLIRDKTPLTGVAYEPGEPRRFSKETRIYGSGADDPDGPDGGDHRRRNGLGLGPIIETWTDAHNHLASGSDEEEVTDRPAESWSETIGTGQHPQDPRHYKKRRQTRPNR
jgi:hypothetical protein